MTQQYARHAGNAISALDSGDFDVVRRQIKLAQLAARKRLLAKQQGRVLSVTETRVETVIDDQPPAPALPAYPRQGLALPRLHHSIAFAHTGTQFYFLLLGWSFATALLINNQPHWPNITSNQPTTVSGVKTDLMRVYTRANEIARQQGFNIHIREGVRSMQDQRKYFSAGASKTLNSRHLTGDALDLEVKYTGKHTNAQDWYWVKRINTAMQQASTETGVPIEWGGDWKSFKDGYHFQLPWSSSKKTGGSSASSAYDNHIAASAKEFGVDPLLVKSVMWKESTFNPNASSGKAHGLMQLIPTTGEMVAKQLKMPSPDLYDPATNIRLGTAYLADLNRQFGRLDHALAAYNAGPTAVRKFGGIPPYPETRDYVNKITGYYNNLKK